MLRGMQNMLWGARMKLGGAHPPENPPVYRKPSRMFIRGIDGQENVEILSEEGTTKGIP